MIRAAFASVLLWTGALTLLGFVALMCAIGSRIAGIPVHPAAIELGRVDPGPAQFCSAPMPVCVGKHCPIPRSLT